MAVWRTILLVAALGGLAAGADLTRRYVWAANVGREPDPGLWLAVTGAIYVPWIIYACAILVGCTYRATWGLPTLRALLAHTAGALVLTLVHPVLLGVVYLAAGIPGAAEASIGTLYLDVLLNYVQRDLLVALLVSAVAFTIGLRRRAECRLIEAETDRGRAVQLTHRGKVIRVPLGDIDWIAAAGNYVALHVGEREHVVRGSLGALESGLDDRRFVRTHRSTIANLDRAREMKSTPGGWRLVLSGGATVPVSRRRAAEVRERLSEHTTAPTG